MKSVLQSIFVVVALASRLNADTSSIRHVTTQVGANQRMLQRLLVDAYMTTRSHDKSHTDRIVCAFAPHCCFLDFMHLTGPTDPPWLDNGRFQLWLTDDTRQVFYPFTRLRFASAQESFTSYWASPYAMAIGWHPEAAIFSLSSDKQTYLAELCNSMSSSRLQLVEDTGPNEPIELVIVDNIVSEHPGEHDRLWFAPQYGFALVKRVISRNVSGVEHRRVCECSDFRKTADSLWLPWRIEHTAVDVINSVHTVRNSFVLDVTRLNVNGEVPDAIFACASPPGTLTMFEDQAMAFESGGEDLLDLWSAVCATALSPEARPGLMTWQIATAIGSTILIGLSLPVYLWRARRQKRRRVGPDVPAGTHIPCHSRSAFKIV